MILLPFWKMTCSTNNCHNHAKSSSLSHQHLHQKQVSVCRAHKKEERERERGRSRVSLSPQQNFMIGRQTTLISCNQNITDIRTENHLLKFFRLDMLSTAVADPDLCTRNLLDTKLEFFDVVLSGPILKLLQKNLFLESSNRLEASRHA